MIATVIVFPPSLRRKRILTYFEGKAGCEEMDNEKNVKPVETKETQGIMNDTWSSGKMDKTTPTGYQTMR